MFYAFVDKHRYTVGYVYAYWYVYTTAVVKLSAGTPPSILKRVSSVNSMAKRQRIRTTPSKSLHTLSLIWFMAAPIQSKRAVTLARTL